MAKAKCIKCGNVFRTISSRGKSHNVNSCGNCTRLFSDGAVDQILDEFKRKF